MFSNSTDQIFLASNSVVTGLENIYVAAPTTAEYGIIYVSDEAVFFNEGNLSGAVVHFSQPTKTPINSSEPFVASQFVKQNVAAKTPSQLTEKTLNPFSGGSGNENLLAIDAVFIVPFAGKNSKKNSSTTLQLSLFVVHSDDAARELKTKNSLNYGLCSVRHSFYKTTSLFGRPPPFSIGSC
jgi:hypothetical protein